jgi:hypothetical protein
MVRLTASGLPPQTDSITITPAADGLLGPPIAYRAASAAAAAFTPLAAFHFRRTERVRVEWPALGAIDSATGRLLDRKGQPLQVPVAVTTRQAGSSSFVVADVTLAPLSIGEYLIEVTATSGAAREKEMVAIRVAMAR